MVFAAAATAAAAAAAPVGGMTLGGPRSTDQLLLMLITLTQMTVAIRTLLITKITVTLTMSAAAYPAAQSTNPTPVACYNDLPAQQQRSAALAA